MLLKILFLTAILDIGLSSVCNTNYSVKEVCYLKYGIIIDVIDDVTSFAVCAALCCEDPDCASVVFNGFDKICILNSGIATTFSESCGLKYASFIQSNCKSLKIIDRPCNTNEDCISDVYSCVEGGCFCSAGYSFNPANESCLTTCDHYGNSFTTFHGHLIAGYNDLKLINMNETSCMDACVTTTDFTCLSIEMSSTGDCFLSSETALTQKDKYTEHPDYSYSQRNCNWGEK